MQIPKTYSPAGIEDKWYAHWMKNQYFHSEPDERTPFTIVIPPPNVTGVLHMGHMLNNTLQDVLIRRARMQGFNACWVPGTDHASIATEARVVKMLADKGINKNDLSREEFLEYAWQWREKHGGIILEQLKKLGASCDWDRTRFTLEDKLSDAVIKVFVDLHNKGYIYRGVRMVNWDPQSQTAISDEEVNYTEEQSKLYYIQYPIEGEPGKFVTIATTRPETILGDTAICVNPRDKRYHHLKGKTAIVPLIDRPIPIIEDEYVQMEFGTGCLKITPAHDLNDYEIGIRHQLPTIDILNDNGTLSEAAEILIGEDRFEARNKIIPLLEKAGYLVKAEDYVNKIGRSERTNAVIEPKLSMQWFLKMEELVKPALEQVMNDNIKLHPAKFKNMYRSWMENIRNWCISRQLWWGQQIPAWYLPDGSFVVALNESEALNLAKEKTGNNALSSADLRQDPDVVDTWFSSWLWPISVFDGFEDPNNKDISYYYPTNVLITAPEILFFWVARMVIAGYEYRNEKPFHDVYLTGIVRDKQGRKMSKSLGNSPEPLELISQYGADGVRVGMLLCSPAGNDLLFDESLCEQGRNFSNKIWNAMRLVKGWEIQSGTNPENEPAIKWLNAKLDDTIQSMNRSFEQFRVSEALMTIYNFIWDDLCSWYLEMVKPDYGKAQDENTYIETVNIFEKALQLLHPFMPFITEEIWHVLKERKEGDDIIISQMPESKKVDQLILEQGEVVKDIVSQVRNLRNQQNLKPKEPVKLVAIARDNSFYDAYCPLISKLAFLESFAFSSEEPTNASAFMAHKDKFYVIFEKHVDKAQELERLQGELNYLKGFVRSVEGKLSNQRFVQNAPADVVNREKQKLADGQAKMQSIEQAIANIES